MEEGPPLPERLKYLFKHIFKVPRLNGGPKRPRLGLQASRQRPQTRQTRLTPESPEPAGGACGQAKSRARWPEAP